MSLKIGYSVITSVYKNIELRDLKLSLHSIKNQNLKPNEFIVVIDGYCKIKIINYVKIFLTKYFKNKHKIIYNKKNRGIPYSYNKAIKISKFDLVGISDADDISNSNRFNIQIKYLKANRNIAAVGSYLLEINKKKNYTKKVPLGTDRIKLISIFKNPMNHPTILFNKKLFFRKLKYLNCERMEDYYLWLRAINQNLKICNIPKSLVTTKIDFSFFKRRSGLKLIKSEFLIQKTILKRSFLFFPLFILNLIIKSLYHISYPNFKPKIRSTINDFIN